MRELQEVAPPEAVVVDDDTRRLLEAALASIEAAAAREAEAALERAVDYSVIDENGTVLRSGTCSFRDMQSMAGPGEAVIDGKLDDVTDAVEFGADGFERVDRPVDGPTAKMVRKECSRRILSRYPVWRQMNIIREGGAALDEMSRFIDGHRAICAAMAAGTIPADFTDNQHWKLSP